MLTSGRLGGFQRAEFALASRFRLWAMFFQLALATLIGTSFFCYDHTSLDWHAGASAVSLILWLSFEALFRRHRFNAERGRRAVLLVDGLGQSLSKTEIDLMKKNFGVSSEEAARWEDREFFSSTDPPGPARLAGMLAESAFWTSRLQAVSATIMSAIFAIIVVILLLVDFSLCQTAVHESGAVAIKTSLSLVAFCLSSGLVTVIQGHRFAASAIAEISARILRQQGNGFSFPEVLILMTDYNAAVESAPINFPLAYRLLSNKLEREWRDLMKSGESFQRPPPFSRRGL
jgi:hypothetical protein